jgi:hypothetical protein
MPASRRARRAVATVTAVATAMVCLTGCSGSDGAATTTKTARATAGPDTGTTAVRGTISEDGEPLGGVTVLASLFPEDDDTPVGGTVDTLELPTATTDDEGRYVLRIDPDDLSSTYFDGEYLNVDLRLFTRASVGSWSTTVFLVDGRVWRSDEGSRVGDAVLRLDADLGRGTVTTTDSLGKEETSRLPVL